MNSESFWLWFGLPALLLLIVLLFLVILARRLTARNNPGLPFAEHGNALAALVVLSEPPQYFLIESFPWRIGRDDGNDLALVDPSVSRFHAVISSDPVHGFHIRDLNSMNGVYVNRKRVNQVGISHGDTVWFGDVACRFVVTAVMAASQKPAQSSAAVSPPH